MTDDHKMVFGLIVGNRSFFPDRLAREGREDMLRILSTQGYEVICPSPEDTKYGSVETLKDARRCAAVFKSHQNDMDGIIVSLPNFGDEKNVANTIRMSGLDVPVLVHAFPDEPGKMLMGARRDSFCGKISVCNNFWQYGIKFTLTRSHTVAPETDSFKSDLRDFASTCRIVRGLSNLRVGVIGARPAAFNTVRFSEKLMEHAGITVETLDLSEVFGRVTQLEDDDPRVTAKCSAIGSYVPAKSAPAASLMRMAKFGVVIDEWARLNELAGTSVQCWTAMQEHFGVFPCTIMSMMSQNLMPSACETDMIGMVAMYILQLASGTPSAIVDWNNNFGDDPDKAVIFHCSNLPRHFFEDFKMDRNEIFVAAMGVENSFGSLSGQLKQGAITFCRASTDDLHGKMRAYVGEGEITPDKFQSFGGYGVVRIPRLQELLHYVCERGYEHHVCVNLSRTARAVSEALGKYKGWEVHQHAALRPMQEKLE
ncbi:MAG TPA: L-fucose/L-arabinose isomerase family protein [Terriglobia bacterium]|nr:L-fucose/L-arabinose isomerase family protein [Terriglobia bacterium]